MGSLKMNLLIKILGLLTFTKIVKIDGAIIITSLITGNYQCIYKDSTMNFSKDGKLRNTRKGPAIKYKNGLEIYILAHDCRMVVHDDKISFHDRDGEFYRSDDGPHIEFFNGNKMWVYKDNTCKIVNPNGETSIKRMTQII